MSQFRYCRVVSSQSLEMFSELVYVEGGWGQGSATLHTCNDKSREDACLGLGVIAIAPKPMLFCTEHTFRAEKDDVAINYVLEGVASYQKSLYWLV